VVREKDPDEGLQVGEEVWVRCTGEGLVNLRQVRGFELVNTAELLLLGTHRRRRRLYEATVHTDAPLLTKAVTAEHMRNEYGACIITVRRPGQRAPVHWRHAGSEELKAGDIVVFEADRDYTDTLLWSRSFALVRELPNSSPPRTGTPADRPRAIFVCAGMALLVGVVGLKDIPHEWNYLHEMVSLDVGAGVFVLLLLLTRAITPETMFASMKPGVLLTIAGAFGLGKALESMGVAAFIAEKVMSVAGTMGRLGAYSSVYLIAVGLSMFINNSAAIVLVAPMLDTMRKLDGVVIQGKYLTMVLVFAAGSCFTTPLGYQTNMMVMKDGGYKFGDFIKFGGPLQLVHAVLCVGMCMLAERVAERSP